MFQLAALKVVGDPKLHCESCEQRVTRVLNTLQGVRQVSADAGSQRIEVLFDPAKLEETAIVERLGLLGYTTEPVERVAGPMNRQATRGQPR